MKKATVAMAMAVVVAFGATANAAVTTTTEFSTVTEAYAGDVSDSDLMHGLTMTHYGAPLHPSSNIACTNDGYFDKNSDGLGLDDYTYSDHGHDWGGILDFGPAGVDIGSVQTITANTTTGSRVRQDYSLWFSYVGDPDNFGTEVAIVSYYEGTALTEKVTISDDASPTLASGVRKIKFFLPEDATGGQMFFVEWDVFAPAADGVIPEPAGLSLIGLALLSLRKKRNACG